VCNTRSVRASQPRPLCRGKCADLANSCVAAPRVPRAHRGRPACVYVDMSRASSSNSTLSAAAAPPAGSGSAAGGACRSAATASPAPIPVPTPCIPVRAALLLAPSCSALCAAPNGAAAGGRRMAGAPTGLVGVLLRSERAAATPSASFSPPAAAPCKSCVAALASLGERPQSGGGRVAEGDPLVLDGAEASLGRTVSRQPSFQRWGRSPRPPAPGHSLLGRVVVARAAAWLRARMYSSSRTRISSCSLSLFSLATYSRAASGHLQAILLSLGLSASTRGGRGQCRGDLG